MIKQLRNYTMGVLLILMGCSSDDNIYNNIKYSQGETWYHKKYDSYEDKRNPDRHVRYVDLGLDNRIDEIYIDFLGENFVEQQGLQKMMVVVSNEIKTKREIDYRDVFSEAWTDIDIAIYLPRNSEKAKKYQEEFDNVRRSWTYTNN